MKKTLTAATVILLFFGGCAKKADEVSAAYVSPLQYQNYSCKQLQTEMARVGTKVSEVAGIQNKTANKDAAAMTVGLIVFWPALFFLAGGDKEEELGRLKGEYEALQRAANEKECSFMKEYDQNATTISYKLSK